MSDHEAVPVAVRQFSVPSAKAVPFQRCVAGVASVLPAASVARTSKVCEPWLRPV